VARFPGRATGVTNPAYRWERGRGALALELEQVLIVSHLVGAFDGAFEL